jgi:hypothetical protein
MRKRSARRRWSAQSSIQYYTSRLFVISDRFGRINAEEDDGAKLWPRPCPTTRDTQAHSLYVSETGKAASFMGRDLQAKEVRGSFWTPAERNICSSAEQNSVDAKVRCPEYPEISFLEDDWLFNSKRSFMLSYYLVKLDRKSLESRV